MLKFSEVRENMISKQTLDLTPNEFTDYSDSIGLFEEENEPKSWLSIESFKQSETVMSDSDGIEYTVGSGRRLPNFEIEIEMSDKLQTFERAK